MKILAIETSCDETAIAILEGKGSLIKPELKILSNAVLSQIAVHKSFGGVVPNLAMREHQKNLVPILTTALKEAELLQKIVKQQKLSDISVLLSREPVLSKKTETFLKTYKPPDIDTIAVTYGPGLEPALWVGINFAKALASAWKKQIIPINHLEGHIYASWITETNQIKFPQFPILALIVSGGHTELILAKKHFSYHRLGETRDDASGEAFDKVARILGLGYPGGPEISKLASQGNRRAIHFPRPMIYSDNFDFSFSGLKTSVLYYVRDIGRLNKKKRADIAASFEKAVIDVLCAKTAKAIKKYKPRSLIVGGGVAANKHLRSSLEKLCREEFPNMGVYLSPLLLTGDNAAMIAVAGYMRAQANKYGNAKTLEADGNAKL